MQASPSCLRRATEARSRLPQPTGSSPSRFQRSAAASTAIRSTKRQRSPFARCSVTCAATRHSSGSSLPALVRTHCRLTAGRLPPPASTDPLPARSAAHPAARRERGRSHADLLRLTLFLTRCNVRNMTAPALTRLRSSFDRLPGALQQAARWVADHPADVCFLSLREQARRADVVPPTMTRLSRALGYPSFRAFQDDFRAEVAWGSADFSVRARRMQTRGKRSDQGSERLAQLQAADIESLGSLNARADIERAAALLLETRRAAFLGFRSCHSAALHAHYLYSMLVGRAELLEDAYGTMLEAVASL